MSDSSSRSSPMKVIEEYPNYLEYSDYISIKNYRCPVKENNFTVRTFSVKAASKTGKIVRYGSDDTTYLLHPELLELVPRGYSELYLNGKLLLILKGMTKFDGTSAIDEDNIPIRVIGSNGDNVKDSPVRVIGSTCNDNEAKSESLINHTLIKKWEVSQELSVVFEEKANGKFMLFTLFELDGDLWIFGGSKNLHVPIRLNLSDSAGNEGLLINNPELLHNQILLSIIKVLKEHPIDLVRTLIGKTIIGEYVDGKHLVWTPEPYIIFFNERMKNFGFETKYYFPEQMIIPTNSQLNEIRLAEDIEGVVINYTNTRTGTIIRQKHKTIWYIVLRCWREALVRDLRIIFNPKDVRHRLCSVLKRRNSDFLHMTLELLNPYVNLAGNFVGWLNKSKYSYHDVSFTGIGMAKIWHDFTERNENGGPERNDTKNENECKDVENKNIFTDFNEKIKDFIMNCTSYKLVIILQGLPGSGKSTFAKKVTDRFEDATSFSTDTYFIDSQGNYNFDQSKLPEYHAKNYQEFVKSRSRIKIVDNTNLSKKEYSKYVYNAKNKGYIVLFVSFTEINLTVLKERNTKGIDIDTLEAMAKRYIIPPPVYYGIFIIDLQKGIEIKQSSVLHITCVFKPQEKYLNSEYTNFIGEKVAVITEAVNVSEAGECLLVSLKNQGDTVVPYTNPLVCHITIATNEGYSPVDVGKMISRGTTRRIQKGQIEGIFLPCW